MVEYPVSKKVYVVWVMYTNGEYQLVQIFDDEDSAREMVNVANGTIRLLNDRAKEKGEEENRTTYWYTNEQMITKKKEETT